LGCSSLGTTPGEFKNHLLIREAELASHEILQFLVWLPFAASQDDAGMVGGVERFTKIDSSHDFVQFADIDSEVGKAAIACGIDAFGQNAAVDVSFVESRKKVHEVLLGVDDGNCSGMIVSDRPCRRARATRGEATGERSMAKSKIDVFRSNSVTI
jgi:hypothetical protein